MKTFWRASAGALLALGLSLPMAQSASSVPVVRSGSAGPNIGAARSMPSGPNVGSGVRAGGGAPRAFSAPSAPRFSAPRHSFNPAYKGGGNWSGKGGKNWGGGQKWTGGKWSGKGGHHHGGTHRHYRRGYGYVLPYYFDDYDNGYGDSCAWLWRKWLQTGNPKWKYRYYECTE